MNSKGKFVGLLVIKENLSALDFRLRRKSLQLRLDNFLKTYRVHLGAC